jgi:hypothetical protein
LGAPTREAGFAARELLYHPGWLHARYVRDVMTLTEVAAIAGTSRQAVTRALERYGIARRPAARRFIRAELTDADWLSREYLELRKTTVEIARTLAVTPTSVNRALRRQGIPLRPPRHQRRSSDGSARPPGLTRLCSDPDISDRPGHRRPVPPASLRCGEALTVQGSGNAGV